MKDLGWMVFGVCCLSLAGVMACVQGCDGPRPSPAQVRLAEQEKTLEDIAKRRLLPEGAYDVKSEGGEWVSFTIARDGVKHRYLYRFWYGSHGEIGHTVTRMD